MCTEQRSALHLGAPVQYKMLGPVGIHARERFHLAGSPREQAVLAVLLMERCRAVAARTIADRLWDGDPPDGFRSTLASYVSRLRRQLSSADEAAGKITGGPAGYRIDVPVDEVDVHCFDRLVAQAQSRAATDPPAARNLFRQAEALWSGEPLAGVAGAWAATVRRILTDKRRTAILRRVELDLLADGTAAEAVVELRELAGVNHTDQRVARLLMTALDRDGRNTEALTVFRELRDRLHDQTGTEPGQELRALHQRLLNGTARTQPAPATVDRQSLQSGMDTLDPAPAYLAGRESDLSDLIDAVTTDLRTGKRAAIFSISGLPGSGKTALALHAAHQLRSRCPDGALQINLHAHDPHLPPLDPREALTQLLDAFGTPFRELGRADTLPALAALWRRRTSGRRLLLVLDDAQGPAQIEPLIPATPGTIALITSRRHLTGPPGLRQHTLAPLSDDAAVAILADITERDLPQDDDLVRFTRVCAGLALAITLAAGHLRSRPAWTVGDLVTRFSMTSRALADDPLTGPIHTAFAMSYQALEGTLRDLLRYIAAHPGPDIAPAAAAAMSKASQADTDVRLDALVDHRLLDHTGPHRYRLHDLLRQFLLAHSDEQQAEDSRQGVERAITFYRAAAARADHAQNPRRRALDYPAASAPVDGVPLDTADQARTWLDHEHLNLAAITTWTGQHGGTAQTGLLPHVLVQHLDRRGRSHQALELIAQALGEPPDTGPDADSITARLLADQAGLYFRTEELGSALESAQAALAIWNTSSDRYGQADTHFQMGRVHWYSGHLDQAVAAYRTAAALYEGLGDLSRVAATENLWAIATYVRGQHDQAIALSNHALDLARHENDLTVIADVLIDLGEMHRKLGRDTHALACFHEARTLSATLGDPLITAVVGNNIGAIYQHAGNHQQALASFDTALQLLRAIGDHHTEIDSLVFMAASHTLLADHDAAFEALRTAAALADKTHDQLQQSQVRLAEGDAYRAIGEILRAIEAYQRALDLAQDARALMEQAQAHRALSEVFTATGDTALAHEHRQSALAIDSRLS
ncbi:AfsR/SARP family transcriptional regulator [Catenulispora pinisilvae]|uniref:AfsR/SARP family transcriptional regulator n=1 Tax=Catenulispora pinisilvae TaxID=2705253 RepID=UPI002B26F241|nr:tetratricopeptide repeat protein [Catenulispora pinisilvae]